MILGALLASLVPTIGQAQSPHVTQLEGMDFDGLITCSIVYQRIAETYAEAGDTDQATEFTNAAMAYSATSLHVLGYRMPDPDAAYTYTQSRMPSIVEALNTQSDESEQGDAAVIAQWLPYCDYIGQNVNYALEKRETRGW